MINRYGFDIRKSSDGTIRICTRRMTWIVDLLPRLSFEERVEKVKWSLLTAGFVYSEDVEKLVHETLNS